MNVEQMVTAVTRMASVQTHMEVTAVNVPVDTVAMVEHAQISTSALLVTHVIAVLHVKIRMDRIYAPVIGDTLAMATPVEMWTSALSAPIIATPMHSALMF